MNTSLFISSYKRDFQYLKYCIRSINKYARGFHEVILQIPDIDWPEFTDIIGPEIMSQKEIKYVPIALKEWANQGMMFHMLQILNADQHCRNADFIGHFDSDSIFTEPVTPDTFIKDGKPYLQYESFDMIGKRHPGNLEWQKVTQRCLPFDVLHETMRGLPHFYEINTYEKTRDLMMLHTKMACDDYIKSCKSDFPQGWCEHVTLGNVALQCFSNDYEPINMTHQPNPDRSRWPVRQHWSHSPPNEPQHVWIYGEQKVVIPLQVYHEFGLD